MLKKSKFLLLTFFCCQFLFFTFLSSMRAEDLPLKVLLQRQYQNLEASQKHPAEKADSIYWASLDSMSSILALMGRTDEAYRLENTALDYRMAIANKNSGREERLVQRAIAFCMIPVIFVFAFFAFVIYRNRRELMFRKKEAEVELKALRSQMNPHFIFNCMNSIYKFMYDNNSREAGNYLIRFSKLIRSILENSNYQEIELVKEVETLELYIQMEQLRLSHRFNYEINYIDELDPGDYMIPPLILQPFVENSIWHGLNNRPNEGMLKVNIERRDKYVRYEIEDNGMLAPEKSNNDIKEKLKPQSLGSGLTKERIALLNRGNDLPSYFNEHLLYDEHGNYCGRKVELFLPCQD